MSDFNMFDEFDNPEDLIDENVNLQESDGSISTQILNLADEVDIQITQYNTVYVHSTEVANKFSMRHDNVIRAIEKVINNDETGESSKLFAIMPYKDTYGREQKGFAVSQSGLNLLSLNKIHNNHEMLMAFNLKFNAANRRIKLLLSKANKRIEELENQLQQQSQLTPMTRDELIAKALIASQEVIQEKDALIGQQQQLIEQKDQEIAAAQDDIDFATAFRGSDNDMLIRTLANKISGELKSEGYPNNVGQNTMFEWLRRNGFLVASRKTRDFNMPTKKSIEMGVMDSKYSTIQHKTMPGTWNSGTPVITPKGVEYFRRKIKAIYYDGGSINDDSNN